ncbi:MAG: 3'-5' exonuclease [Acidobacteria bacterium]|nr:3'-5' exonuclease [Acidobacteriota bacterium]
MFYSTRQSYTPTLEPHEFDRHALIVDTETVGSGPLIEIIEIALGDTQGRIVFNTLVRPVYNSLPPLSKHRRFDRAELAAAPEWTDIWAELSALIDGKLLVAYNAAFDRRALAATCSRYRLTSQERGWRCALQLVKRSVGTKKNVTLTAACAHHGLEGGTHRAVADVQATYRLLRALIPQAA